MRLTFVCLSTFFTAIKAHNGTNKFTVLCNFRKISNMLFCSQSHSDVLKLARCSLASTFSSIESELKPEMAP
jgi:hypothetical protein